MVWMCGETVEGNSFCRYCEYKNHFNKACTISPKIKLGNCSKLQEVGNKVILMYDSDAQMIIMVPYQGLYLREEVTQPPV
jgi:hypothetical protein